MRANIVNQKTYAVDALDLIKTLNSIEAARAVAIAATMAIRRFSA